MIVGSQLKNAQLECVANLTAANALTDKVEGRMVYNIDTDQVLIYDGAAWIPQNEIYADNGTSKVFDAGTDGSNATITATLTGTCSTLSNHDTDDLAEGTNLYYTAARVNALSSLTNYTTTTNTQIKYSKKQVAGSGLTAVTRSTGSTELTDLRYINVPAGFYRLTFETRLSIAPVEAGEEDAIFTVHVQTDAVWTTTTSPTVEIVNTSWSAYNLGDHHAGGTDNINLGIPFSTVAYFTLAGTENIYTSIGIPDSQTNSSDLDIDQAATWSLLEKLPLHTATKDWD